MTWRDRLSLEGDGSFRGIRFHVQRTENTIGRVGVLHEFPGRSDPYFEDMKRATRRFTLTCFVLGENYDAVRDDLREAFETAGPGGLIHPYWGSFHAQIIEPVQMPESPDEMGIVRWTMTMVEITDVGLTKAVADAAKEVEAKADVAAEAVAEEFAEEFSILGAIDSVRQSAINGILTLTTGLAAARARVNSALAVIDDVADGITAISQGVASLILLPLSLANAVRGVVTATLAGVARIDNALSDLIAGGGQDTAPGTGNLFGDFRAQKVANLIGTLAVNGASLTPQVVTNADQSSIEGANRAASIQLYRAMSVIEGARAISNLDFESRDTVLNIAALLDGLLGTLALDAGDTLFGALSDLREALARQMAAKAEALPALVDYVPPEARCILAIAYDIHEDATRETEIIGRNNVTDPSQCRPLKPLKVVVNE